MKSFKEFHNEKLLVSELGSLYKYYKDNEIITDYPLNITNSESVKLLKRFGVKQVTLSPEIYDYDVLNYTCDTEVFLYGKPELMVIENFHTDGDNLVLKDRFGKTYKIINGKYTRIMHHENIDKLVEKIKSNIRINLLDESDNEIDEILKRVNK